MTFNECELAILRHAVDETTTILKKKKLENSEEVKKMILILEDFLVKKKRICYGGTAINNILPQNAQFYDKETEVPDYDFYSPNALEDAKELANLFYMKGYEEVEAKAGVHHGTFKVFVNFIPMADITFLHPLLYKTIQKEQITIAGIKYAPANFLRMNMFLELSRPAGDVSRWEKVLKRLNLLNDFYPLKSQVNCKNVSFQRSFNAKKKTTNNQQIVYNIVRDTFLNLEVIFFGGYGCSLYSMYLPKTQKQIIQKIPDFDVLSEDPDKTAKIVKEQLLSVHITNVKIVVHKEVDEIIPYSVEIFVGDETIAFIYKPMACHNYNTITIDNKKINVATIDTILSFYLAFYYTNKPYYSHFKDRYLCMAQFMFDVEKKNRLEQKGLLKRFSIICYGKQPTLEDMRAEKARMFLELKNNPTSNEYEMWFLKYNPATILKKKQPNPAATTTIKKKKKNSRRQQPPQHYRRGRNKTQKKKFMKNPQKIKIQKNDFLF